MGRSVEKSGGERYFFSAKHFQQRRYFPYYGLNAKQVFIQKATDSAKSEVLLNLFKVCQRKIFVIVGREQRGIECGLRHSGG